jgi:hypothetical protein
MSRTAATVGTRPKRTPIGQRNVLSVSGKEEGYVYRIVNDTADRIQQFIDAGYELVDAGAVRVGDKRVNTATPEGTKAQVSVGKGDKAFVMRIKDEYFKEDQAAKAAEINRLEQTMKQKASGTADYGALDIKRGS